jgi:ubiquinone/menaquinone biosynthesis C-methylase UbiE
MNENLVSYYNDRAREYEKVYLNPDEQDNLLTATKIFQNLFAEKTVLEIACGTGYWTERIAKTAVSILATDVNESVIALAREKQMPGNVSFTVADMFAFTPNEQFGGVFAGFIWSHVFLQDLDAFLQKVKSFLKPNGALVFIDGNPVEGTNHDFKNITKTDEYGNTFQTRKLENGETHLVLKNFPTREFLLNKLSEIATDIDFIELEYYWIVSCKLAE